MKKTVALFLIGFCERIYSVLYKELAVGSTRQYSIFIPCLWVTILLLFISCKKPPKTYTLINRSYTVAPGNYAVDHIKFWTFSSDYDWCEIHGTLDVESEQPEEDDDINFYILDGLNYLIWQENPERAKYVKHFKNVTYAEFSFIQYLSKDHGSQVYYYFIMDNRNGTAKKAVFLTVKQTYGNQNKQYKNTYQLFWRFNVLYF